MFFFGSFEGYKREYSLPTFFSVPDAALRAGDFSGATNNGGTQQIDLQPVHRRRDRRRARGLRRQPDSRSA